MRSRSRSFRALVVTAPDALTYAGHDYELHHGDLLEEVPFFERWAFGEEQLVRYRCLGVVTSHGCVCERFLRKRDSGKASDQELASYTLHVSPVDKIDDFDPGILGDIRKGRVHDLFALPSEGKLPEFIVDLSQEQPIPAATVMELRRMASLSEDCMWALMLHRFRYQTRVDLNAAAEILEKLRPA
jgi:hypothetical protein